MPGYKGWQTAFQVRELSAHTGFAESGSFSCRQDAGQLLRKLVVGRQKRIIEDAPAQPLAASSHSPSPVLPHGLHRPSCAGLEPWPTESNCKTQSIESRIFPLMTGGEMPYMPAQLHLVLALHRR